jgi:hypothetical protein
MPKKFSDLRAAMSPASQARATARAKAMLATTYHPQRDDDGRLVVLKRPHQRTPLSTWADPRAVSTVVPAGPMPTAINDIQIASWADAPNAPSGWEKLAASGAAFEEPPFDAHSKNAAAGAIIIEGDGRVWLTSPSNQHGGYQATFPKGTVDAKLSRNSGKR